MVGNNSCVISDFLIGVLVLIFWGSTKFVLTLLWTGVKIFLSVVLWIVAIPFKILKSLFQQKNENVLIVLDGIVFLTYLLNNTF